MNSKLISVVLALGLISESNYAGTNMHIEVQGHRGTRGTLPENTLPAFRAALEAGADVLEMDLAVTSDGELVISHDPHINSELCLNSDGSRLQTSPLIHSLTLAQVKQFDCGSLKNPRFPQQVSVPGARIPTLNEVFELVRESKHPKAKTIGFNLETKIFPEQPKLTIGPTEFAKKVIQAAKKSGFWKRITLQSFDPRTLIEAKKLSPHIRTVLLIENSDLNMIEAAKNLGVESVSPDFSLLTAEQVAKLHQAELKVIPWTVNEIEDWKKMARFKVDGIITDYPSSLIEYLKKEGLR